MGLLSSCSQEVASLSHGTRAHGTEKATGGQFKLQAATQQHFMSLHFLHSPFNTTDRAQVFVFH